MKATLQALASWFCTCLGITLIGCGVLVVPERAFADWVSDCQNGCCKACFGEETCDTLSSCYLDCTQACFACAESCNYDTTCINNNCQVKMCPGDPCQVGETCFKDYNEDNCPKTNAGLCDKKSNCSNCICKKVAFFGCACKLKIPGD